MQHTQPTPAAQGTARLHSCAQPGPLAAPVDSRRVCGIAHWTLDKGGARFFICLKRCSIECEMLMPTTSATVLPRPAAAMLERPSLAPNIRSICSPAIICTTGRGGGAGVFQEEQGRAGSEHVHARCALLISLWQGRERVCRAMQHAVNLTMMALSNMPVEGGASRRVSCRLCISQC